VAPRFRSGRERAAAERAAQAEVARLRALPAADLAAELMEAFGEDGAHAGLLGRNMTPLAITEWLLRDHQRAARHLRELYPAVGRGLRLLEAAGMVERGGSQTVSAKARLKATALGLVALRRDRVRDYLGPDDADDAAG